MIPYQDLTLKDFLMYWRQSFLLARIAVRKTDHPKWYPMKFEELLDSEGNHVDTDDGWVRGRTLEQLEADGYGIRWKTDSPRAKFRTRRFGMMHQFTSPDWITYMPTIGYLLIDGRLWHVSQNGERAYVKGLHSNRFTTDYPLDHESGGPDMPKLMHPRPFDVAEAYCCHLNALPPTGEFNWPDAILSSIKDNKPKVISPTVAVLPGGGCAYLLVQRQCVATVTKGEDNTISVDFVDTSPPLPEAAKRHINTQLAGWLAGEAGA